MRKLYLLLLSVLCINHYCYSQLSQDPQLQELLSSKADTATVMKLCAYAKKLIATDKKQATQMLQLVLEHSKQLKFDKGIGSGNLLLGNLAMKAGDMDAGLKHFKVGYYHSTKAGDGLGAGKCLVNMGVVYNKFGKKDSTLHMYMAAINELEKHRAEALPTLSVVYMNLGHIHGDNFDDITQRKEGYEKVIYYYKKGEQASREAKDTVRLVSALASLSTTYASVDAKKALGYGKESLQLAKLIDDYSSLALANDAYARAQLTANRFDEALVYSNEAVKNALLAEDISYYFLTHYTLADILGARKEYQKQVQVLEKTLETCKDGIGIHLLYRIHENLSNAYAHIGNHQKAYSNLKQSILYSDSSINDYNNKIIAELETKYQSAQKEKTLSQQQLQISQKEVQLQRTQQLIWLSVAAAVVAILSASLVWLQYRNKQRLHQQQLQALENEKQLQLMQAVIQGEEKERGRIAKELHDGVAGILSAAKMQLSALIMKDQRPSQTKSHEQVVSLLDEAHQEVRKTSHNLMPEVLLKYGLQDALQRYCSNISTPEKLDVIFSSWGEIGPYKQHFELAIYRIVQELLGNVIKHAKATTAHVQLSKHQELLLLEVEDNGTGFSSATALTSIGLQSLQARVQSLNGNISFESRNTGLTVHLEFDVTAWEQMQVQKQSNVVV
jgi:signal transduction histidine kinase